MKNTIIFKGDLLIDVHDVLGWVVEERQDADTLILYGRKVYMVEWNDGLTSWQYADDVISMKYRLEFKLDR